MKRRAYNIGPMSVPGLNQIPKPALWVGGHHPVCGPLRLGRAMVGALAAHSATLAWRSFGAGEGTAQPQKEATSCLRAT